MQKVHLIEPITSYLIQFSEEVRTKGRLKLADTNIIAEDVLVPVLGIAYETRLINLNAKKSNYPGIDLATDDSFITGDTFKKIAFQITSDSKAEKIIETLEQISKREFYKDFDEFYIYNLV